MLIHVVQRGETIWLISNRYKVGANSIIRVNGLEDPEHLVIGQALVIPVPDEVYIIRPGDSLWKIAQLYNTTVNALIQENQISNPSLLSVGQVLQIPKPTIEVNGYVQEAGTGGQDIVRQTGPMLTYVSMFSYAVRPDASLVQLNDAPVLSAAKETRAAPLMALTNFTESGFSSDVAHTILSSPELQQRMLTNVINTMKQKGYVGLNIDFEYVYPRDRELYNQFLARAVPRLHERGYSVSTALAPKVRADQPGLLYEAHDYPVHGRLVDFVVLMTYEWGWVGGPPMAIAPIDSVRHVLDYAVTAIPRSKIMMGIPLYAYDWKLPYVWGTTRAETIFEQDVIRRAVKYGAAISYDTTAQSPHFNYTDENGTRHEVWFEDARSYQAKYDTIKAYGLRGASYWALNLYTPQNWPVLLGNFRVRKLA